MIGLRLLGVCAVLALGCEDVRPGGPLPDAPPGEGNGSPDAALGADAPASNDAAGDAAPGMCPNPDPPVADRLTCHMIRFLVQAGFSENQIVEEGLTLRPPNGESLLLQKGFHSRPAGGRYRAIYELGTNPTFHVDGQRVLYAADGTITFLTFASANGGFVQIIVISAGGTVTENTVYQTP